MTTLYKRANPVGRNDDDFQDARPLGDFALPALSALLAHQDPLGSARQELEKAIGELELPYSLCDAFKSKVREQFDRALPLCESPIECRLLPWLLTQRYQFFDYAPLVLLPGESAQLFDRRIALVPQLKIGKRRVDFALAARRGGPIRFVIVECDGAEFHKDVEKDIARDAELLGRARVQDICFFTGKEIWRDPKAAAKEAAKCVLKAWTKKKFA